MPGTFSKTNRPKRPGAYFNFNSVAQETILPNTSGTLGLVITHDWGPFETPVPCRSLAEFQQVFGPSTDTPGYKAAYQAFKGEGLIGRGGAGTIIFWRMGTSEAKSTVVHNVSPADTVPSLTLTARYFGSYGSSLTSTIEDNAADPSGSRDLVLKLNGVEVERFTYPKTDINAAAALVNEHSEWATAVANATGTEIVKSTKAFSGGLDGNASVAAADFAIALDGMETQRFSVFAVAGLQEQVWTSPATATSLTATLFTWASNLNTKGKRFVTVVGGALDETITTAVTRSATMNHPDFVNIGKGGVEDDTLGTLSTSQLAPRIAGILCALGEERSLTFARLQGVTPRNFATEANILTGFDGGVVVLARDTHPDAPVRVEKGLSTYVGGDSNRPYSIYRNPKYVRTMHGIETEITEWAERNVIGQLQVSDTTTQYVVGHAKSVIKGREDRGVLQPGSTIGVDSDPPPQDTDEFIALAYGVRFGRSVEQVFNTVTVG